MPVTRAVGFPVAFGLDVTERAKLTPAHLEGLAARAGGGPENAVVRFVSDALRFYFEFHSRYDGFYGAFIHDALVLAAALDPEPGPDGGAGRGGGAGGSLDDR